jgi:hypothetical protein
MKGNKSKDDKPESKEEVWDKAFMAMCKGLDKFGPREILNILVENARHDEIVFHLLARFPTVVVLGEFLHSLPIQKVDKRTLKRLERKGWLI